LWSWASVDGRVQTPCQINASKNIHCMVLDCKTTPKGTDEHGELVSGTLLLLGSCMPVT
jgi:hypothetical protein